MSEPQQHAGQPPPPHSAPWHAQGVPAQPGTYGAPGHPAPYGAPETSPTPAGPYGAPKPPGVRLGTVAFVIAAVALGMELFSGVLALFLAESGLRSLSAVAESTGVVILLGNVAALVLGILALRRPEPRLLPAIAVGIAATLIVSRLFALVISLAYATLLTGSFLTG